MCECRVSRRRTEFSRFFWLVQLCPFARFKNIYLCTACLISPCNKEIWKGNLFGLLCKDFLENVNFVKKWKLYDQLFMQDNIQPEVYC